MLIGNVKWFNSNKGFGFIQPEQQGDKDVFLHASELNASGIKSIAEGQKVQYDLKEDRGRVAATNIKILG